MYGSDGPGGGSGGPGGGSGGPGGHWASRAVGSISNPPVSEAGSIFPGTPYSLRINKVLFCRLSWSFLSINKVLFFRFWYTLLLINEVLFFKVLVSF